GPGGRGTALSPDTTCQQALAIWPSKRQARKRTESAMTSDITPFTIRIAEADIADLKERLTMTRWPAPVTDDWSHGQKVGFIRELADQWLSDFDWRAHEEELNL